MNQAETEITKFIENYNKRIYYFVFLILLFALIDLILYKLHKYKKITDEQFIKYSNYFIAAKMFAAFGLFGIIALGV